MTTSRVQTDDEQQTGIAVLLLEREFISTDVAALVELEAHLLGAIDGSRTGVLIDLSETDYIGGGFLSILLRGYVRARKNNCSFVLCTLSPLHEKILAITRLNSLWEVFPTRREAIEALQRPLESEYSNDGYR